MIEITDKRDCCGCSACVQRCPRQCISLQEDEEGFLYPKVDEAACTDCGVCGLVCPFANRAEPYARLSVLAAKNRDEDERMRSSSGGVFVPLAREVIREGGVVFGVSFNSAWRQVTFCFAETMEGVYPMTGSKYLQAETGSAYQDAERFLKEGRKVLFSGCPCQVAGLRGFLRREYDNLLSVDCLCHGVPSPGVWRRYVGETLAGLGGMEAVGGIEFRDKTFGGWKRYHFVVRGRSAKADKGEVLFYSLSYNNPFMRGFLADLYLRPSCHACKCKNGRSHSDITIGDYWGVGNSMPEFDDDKGVSLISINTRKGQDYFGRLNVETRATTLGDDVIRCNGGFKEVVEEHPKRALFFRLYNRGVPFRKAVNTCLRKSAFSRALRLLRETLTLRRPYGRIRS